ncbi:unnamed protein product [Lathyrus sativus]|nr:unnamed protein product [Lathyrus sativus]
MARPLQKINNLNNTKELWKVAVQVYHKWLVLTNNKEHIEMIFVDKYGDDIHVIVYAVYMDTFKDKLNVDHTYTVSNFNVQSNDLVFKPSRYKYMFRFTEGTSINDADKHVILAKELNFTNFVDIMTERFQKDVLIGCH